MPSLANIPEPTTAHRTDLDDTSAAAVPLSVGIAAQAAEQAPVVNHHVEREDEPEQQLDSVWMLLLLLIAGGMLRIVLGLFGPLQGIEPFAFQQLEQRSTQLFAGEPTNAYPLLESVWTGLSALGAPGWILVVFGSMITLAAVPAAYIVGRYLTGRCVAGIIAAGILAVHPAVLTASNSVTGSSLAIGLLTSGLALCLLAPKRGQRFAVGGGVLLGLAGLAAPLCWVAALLIVPIVYRRTLPDGLIKSLRFSSIALILAIGPVIAFRAVGFGTGFADLLPEFAYTNSENAQDQPTARLLITLTDPSLSELGEALHLPLSSSGQLTAYQAGAAVPDEQRDVVADYLADGWLLLNAALAGLAAVSTGVLIVRRRYFETLLLVGPLIALAWCTQTPGEAIRLPMMALVGVLAAGLFANRPVVVIDEQALAAKRAAKAAKKEAKERAKQERLLKKHKDSLYAFDKPSRKERKRLAALAEQQAAPQPSVTGILSETRAEESPMPGRPI